MNLTDLNKLKKAQKPTLVRDVLWTSPNKLYVVVHGPFPHNFPRSETRSTVKAASTMPIYEIIGRAETTRDDQYALVYAEHISGPETNEFGPVMP